MTDPTVVPPPQPATVPIPAPKVAPLPVPDARHSSLSCRPALLYDSIGSLPVVGLRASMCLCATTNPLGSRSMHRTLGSRSMYRTPVVGLSASMCLCATTNPRSPHWPPACQPTGTHLLTGARSSLSPLFCSPAQRLAAAGDASSPPPSCSSCPSTPTSETVVLWGEYSGVGTFEHAFLHHGVPVEKLSETHPQATSSPAPLPHRRSLRPRRLVWLDDPRALRSNRRRSPMPTVRSGRLRISRTR